MSAKFIPYEKSNMLSPEEATTMIRQYHCHPNKLKVRNDDSIQTLRGLILDQEDIDKIIRLKEENGVNKFLILFAVSKDSALNETHSIKQSFTTILAPIKLENGVEVIDGSNLINKFLPCPSSCNDAIKSSYSTLFFTGINPSDDCRNL